MKKLLVLIMLIVSMVSTATLVPTATAEYISPTATKSTYVPPNMVGTVTTTQNTGNLDWVPYNNDVLAPVAGGPWGRLVVADYNGDGYLDFTITGNGYGEKGTWRFYGNPDSHNPESPNYMVMGERRKISNYYWTEDYGRCVYDDNGNYLYTTSAAYTYVDYDVATSEGMVGIAAATNNIYNPLYIEGDKIIDGRTIENNNPESPKRLSSANQMRLVDFNGDGLDDIVYGLDEWGTDAHESGAFKIPKYSNSGLWGDNNGDGVVNKADPDHDLNGDGKIDANDVYEDTNGDGVIDENDALCGDGDDDPAHGYVMYILNKGKNNVPVYETNANNEAFVLQVYDYEVDAQGNKTIIPSSNRALDVRYGSPSPIMEDFDNDGDLDLVCLDFVGYFTYYENIGSRTEPVYIAGQRIKDKKGKIIMSSCEQNEAHNVDWNNDGNMDIIYIAAADEGRIYLIENTGKLDANNMPIFNQSKVFMCPADKIHFGCGRPFSADWDSDGDEDLIVADSGGYLFFVKNVTIEKALQVNPNLKVEDIDLSNPSWDTPVHLKTPDDKIFAQKAGYQGDKFADNSDNFGSPQGPVEQNFGYNNISVADWDMDGILDIVYNDVNGRVRYLKGIAGDPLHINYPETLQVEWVNGQKRPGWYNYWQSENPNDLVTLWRTDPNVIDLPLDEDGDGVAEGDGLADLVLVDHEGYFAMYQRYRDRDGSLKLKEGKRIFKLNGSLWAPTGLRADHGKTPWRLVDWDGDGDLDMLVEGAHEQGAIRFHENISTIAGEYNFASGVEIGGKALKYHEVYITICDWNKNGIPDALAMGECGNLYYLINKHQTAN